MLRIIGTGRTCTVYLAWHTVLEEYRAIKKISRDHAGYEDFHKEAVILKSLKAPGIPVIYDVEEDGEYYYLIEEYLEGSSLWELVKSEGVLSKAMTISIGIQICHLVFYLHSAKPNPILYLDLQPKNLLLCHDIVKLVDFGQAVFLKEAGNLKKRYGTAGYAAPEQYTADKLDERTDIYAIGQILHFLFTGMSAGEEERKIQTGWRSFQLEKVIKRCLEAEKEKRYPSVQTLCEELEKIREGKVNKNHISSLTIAFAGNRPGIGTTHLAIGLSEYLKVHGFSNLYEEKNRSNAVRTMAGYAGVQADSCGIYRINGIYMKPFYGEAVRLKTPEDVIRIYDYGSEWEHITDDGADVLILVNGGKWWNIPLLENMREKAAQALFQEFSSGRLEKAVCVAVYNLTVKGIRIKKGKDQNQRISMKAPYFESPFALSPEGKDFYASLTGRIWSGQDRRNRRRVLSVCRERAKNFIKKMFAGS